MTGLNLSVLGESYKADVVLGIRASLRVAHQVDGILLRLQPGRYEVSISHIIAVIDAAKDRGASVRAYDDYKRERTFRE